MPAHREDDEQAMLFDWARLATVAGVKIGDHLIAIPNGGKRNVREAARLKRQGVKAGVSDIQLCYPTTRFHGLWIELKAPKTKNKAAGKPTKLQTEWLESRKALGYAAELCDGWQSAMRTITAYIQGELQ